MSEQTTQASESANVAADVNPFLAESWADTPVEAPKETEAVAVVETTAPAAATTEVVSTASETATIEPNPLKDNLGYESWDAAKQEIENLRKQATTKEEIKFANEQSEKLFKAIKEGKEDEVYEILSTKREIANIDKLDAREILKLQIKKENKEYSNQDIEDILEEKYTTPKKPVQKLDEPDEDYAERVSEWDEKVQKIQRRIGRDSLKAKEELLKLSTDYILPDIAEKGQVDAKAQQEELQKVEAIRANYLQALESGYKSFGGFEIKYKDEEVEIPVSFAITPEDQVSLKEELKEFNVDDFISERWFSNGQPNVKQMMEDVTLLRKKEDVLQKIANEVGAKMKEHYIKVKSNVTIGSQSGTLQPNGEKSDMDTQIEYIWKNS